MIAWSEPGALAPSDPLAFNNRGVALMALSQMDAARQDFERALELDPCLFNARFNLKQLGIEAEVPGNCRFSYAQRRLLESGS